MITDDHMEEESEELMVESIAAQVFHAGDDSILGNLPSSEEMSSHGSELAAMLRIAALIYTKDDAEIESYFKDQDSFDNWLNILERIDRSVDVENAIIKLLETAGNRLLVGAARFKMNRSVQHSPHRNSRPYAEKESGNCITLYASDQPNKDTRADPSTSVSANTPVHALRTSTSGR